MEVAAYAVRVVQTESNFSKALPVESNIAGHNLLKTEISMIYQYHVCAGVGL